MNAAFRLIAISTLVFCAPALSAGYKPPRTPDGKPDLQGFWTNATATPLEREEQFGQRRTYTEAEAAAIEKAARDRVAADALPSDPDAKIEAGALPPVGNYNLFWTDRGMSVLDIKGEKRNSMIVEPSDGRIPALTPQVMQKRAAMRASRSGPADGPEQRSLGERCLLSFGSSAGPPMLPTMYNSYYQIVQSADTVNILVEMVHDVRTIRIGGAHLPTHVRKWMGDSVGRWEGDTLVVETRNFRPDQSVQGSSENMVVTERFTRVADDKIVYQFNVNDPTAFTAPFTGELAFTSVDANIYEYACHEGNYALPGILGAERELEKQRASAAK
jgi:hypothetical protein